MAAYGTDANDYIYNNVAFSYYGGDGDDVLGANKFSVNAYGGYGNDTLVLDSSNDTNGNLGVYLRAFGGEGSDWLVNWSTSTGGDVLYGDSGDDVLWSGVSDDQLDGGTGNDALYGGKGNDHLYGGDGNDKQTQVLAGSTAIASGFQTAVTGGLYGGAGNDYLDGGAGDDYLDAGSGNDELYGGSGADSLLGWSGTDELYGGSGADFLDGDTGNDTLEGGSGADTLAGGTGDDVLSGGRSDDVLIGQRGNDLLSGGTGKDTFRFSHVLDAKTNVDTITDYSVSSDTIALAKSVFTKISGTGTLSSSQFYASSSGLAHDSSDRIIYETDTGKLFYDSDGKGGKAGVLFADLDAHLALTASEFILF